jgi:tetratricopeptide (TPR) repeat protein
MRPERSTRRTEPGLPAAARAALAAPGEPGKCPEAEQLVLFADGRLGRDPELRRLEHHLSRCLHCALIAEDLRHGVAAQPRARPTRVLATRVVSSLAARLRALVAFEMPVVLALTARGAARAAATPEVQKAMRAYRARRFGEARTQLRRAGAADPGARFYLGVCELEAGRAKAAVAALEDAIAVSPALGEYEWYLSQALLLDGRGNDALAHLRRASRRPGPYRSAAGALGRKLEALLRTT